LLFVFLGTLENFLASISRDGKILSVINIEE
jgi:hypothetical protein